MSKSRLSLMRRLAWLSLDSPVPQLRYLPRLIVCLFHFPPRRRAGCGMRERVRLGQPPNYSWTRKYSQQIRAENP